MWRATVYAATARSLASRCLILRRLATNSKAAGRVLGCGSNVVDHIYSVKVVPRAGEKGFFVSPFKALEEKMIGGVTLNHLCWAALGGVPTSLLALQGEDALGIFIRRNLEKLNVSTEFIKVGSMYPTAQCHVFVQEDGERSIVMAPAATSLINSKAVMEHFDGPIQSCASMVTTEISQVPLSGVLELLRSARRAGVLSVLDVDVPPNVAVEEARLGSMEELIECVRMANVLKPSKMAAVGVVRAMNPSAVDEGEVSLQQVAVELARLCESKLVALTNGAEPTILVDSRYHVVQVDPPSIQKVVDTTGAGDAFLGGLLLGITRNGLPQSEGDMKDLATIANAFGATCVQSIGGVPNQHSKQVLERLLPTCMQEVTEEVVTGEDWWRRSAFAASVTVDQEAVGHIADDLLTPSRGRELQQFLKILEACEGHVLVSGVGEHNNNKNTNLIIKKFEKKKKVGRMVLEMDG